MKQVFIFLAGIFFVAHSLAQPTLGLVAYWNMNGNYLDNGPYAIHGTNFSSTVTTNNRGVANSAMNYANPSSTVVQYATHPINSNVNFGAAQDFTIDFSVLTSSQPHAGGIYDNNLNYSGPGVFMWNANGFPQLVFNFKNGSALTTNGALPLNVWKHVACVRAGAVTKIYINGVLNVTSAPGTSTPVYNYPARIGSMFYAGFSPPQYNGHNGKIDELRIYNRALTDLEIIGLSVYALPIKISSFTGVAQGNKVVLNWQTMYEQNSSHFVVQRSTDGIHFNDIANVTATGNSNEGNNYTYTDLPGPAVQMQRNVYYRLQVVDKQGKFIYTDILPLQLGKTDMQLLLSPNPVRNILTVQTGEGLSGAASLLITDASGKPVYKQELKMQAGANSIPVNIALLPPGIYYLRLENGSTSLARQFMKAD